jgi:hypothetical protein
LQVLNAVAQGVSNPSRQWGTYYGGTRRDEIHAVAAFGTNAVYAAGWTQSDGAGVISSPGAHQVNRGSTGTGSSGRDAMLIKFDGNGVRQWATYYGGNQEDQAFGLATDVDGNVYMAGRALSGGGIATAGSHKSSTFSNDAFLVKFNANGVRQWGTYYGSQFSPEDGVACAVDANGNVYLVGNCTGSTEGIATPGAHQASIGGATDAFIVKFNSSGVRQWGTFFGGAGNDFVTGCSVDNNGNVFVSGYTNSAGGISTPGSHQPAQASVNYDSYLAKFSSSGALQWSTYYGGTEMDYAHACRADGDGNVYLAGVTQSTTGISTVGSHQSAKGGTSQDADAYLIKFSGTGVRQWATYYGAAGSEAAYALAINTAGDIMMAGGSNSAGVIATNNGFQTAVGGNGLASDGFFVIFNSSGVRQYGTYYGGGFDDNSTSLALTSTGDLIMGGRTLSTGSVLSTAGAHQTAYNGDDNSASSNFYDGYLVKFGTGNAAVTTYQFTGNGNWSDPANWQGGQLPPATVPSGITITVSPAGSNECVLDIPVTLSPGATLIVGDNKRFRINGNLQIQ